MTRHQCSQLDMLYRQQTEIELLKHGNIITDKDITDLKSHMKMNTVLLITSLVSVILALIGIIAIFLEK